MNIRKSFEYDQQVDIDSLLPVYVIPIVLKARTVRLFPPKGRLKKTTEPWALLSYR
jgi:hypothetical protein